MPTLTVYIQDDLYLELKKRGKPSEDVQDGLRKLFGMKKEDK